MRVPILFFSLFFLLTATYGKKALYLETTDNQTLTNFWKMAYDPAKHEFTIMMSNREQIYSVHCGDGFETKRWNIHHLSNRTHIDALRMSNQIVVVGKLGGQVLQKSLDIDGDSWYQTFELPLGAMVASNFAIREFWGINPQTMEYAKMTAVKDWEGALSNQGRMVEAARVHVALAGPLSVFWSADYYFRKSDGVYVKYIGAKAFGAALTTIELIQEK